MDNFFNKYQKYKKKYLDLKIKQEGGGKRKVYKNLSEEEIITAHPAGSPSSMNQFLLAPETDFIFKKCSKKFGKQCSKENINDVLTYIINVNQTNGIVKKEIDDLAKKTKLSKDFILEVDKTHKEFINDNIVKNT